MITSFKCQGGKPDFPKTWKQNELDVSLSTWSDCPLKVLTCTYLERCALGASSLLTAPSTDSGWLTSGFRMCTCQADVLFCRKSSDAAPGLNVSEGSSTPCLCSLERWRRKPSYGSLSCPCHSLASSQLRFQHLRIEKANIVVSFPPSLSSFSPSILSDYLPPSLLSSLLPSLSTSFSSLSPFIYFEISSHIAQAGLILTT